ncbi:MAG TPA: hypothetical protein VEX60_09830 [Pyrinomonadaceae bacterium]|nr:hypothetical protein [Pyrinomonadaceae bacterium]
MEQTNARAEGEAREDAQGETLEKQNEINELEAEEESAKAMDADVPQPSGPSQPDAERTD